MRRFTFRFRDKPWEEHLIYDSEEEAYAHGVEKITQWGTGRFNDYEVGDWIRADDGYVLQLLAISCYDIGKSNRKLFRFCTGTIHCYWSPKKKDDVFGKFLAMLANADRYSLSGLSDKCRRHPDRKIDFAKLVLAGMPPFWAAKQVYSYKCQSLEGINKIMQSLLADKDVRREITSSIEKTFSVQMAEKFSEKRYIDELDEFLSKTRKGSLSHLAGLKFIGELAGYIKPMNKVKNDSLEGVPVGQYEVMEPPTIEKL